MHACSCFTGITLTSCRLLRCVHGLKDVQYACMYVAVTLEAVLRRRGPQQICKYIQMYVGMYGAVTREAVLRYRRPQQHA